MTELCSESLVHSAILSTIVILWLVAGWGDCMFYAEANLFVYTLRSKEGNKFQSDSLLIDIKIWLQKMHSVPISCLEEDFSREIVLR